MIYTHQKIPYRAYCMQNKGNNVEEMTEFLLNHGYDCWHRDSMGGLYFMQTGTEVKAFGIPVWSWVRIGEDKVAKVFDDIQFRLKYATIGTYG